MLKRKQFKRPCQIQTSNWLHIWVLSKKCHYILSHFFKKRHKGHNWCNWLKKSKNRCKEKFEGVSSDRKISVKVVRWKSRHTAITKWSSVGLLGSSFLKIQRQSFPCCLICLYHLLDSTEKRQGAECWCVTFTKIHILFSHHALGSLNWRSRVIRVWDCFYFCSTMQRDIGCGTLSQNKKDDTLLAKPLPVGF